MHAVSTRLAPFTVLLTGLLLVPARASARGELATACRADVERLCPGVSPGGRRLAHCLEEHAAQLSQPCKQAIADRRGRGGRGPGGGGPGPARGACRDDVARLCPDAMGDREKLRACAREHAAELSEGCKDALAARRQQRRDRPPAR
jgi:hypothetical protein